MVFEIQAYDLFTDLCIRADHLVDMKMLDIEGKSLDESHGSSSTMDMMLC